MTQQPTVVCSSGEEEEELGPLLPPLAPNSKTCLVAQGSDWLAATNPSQSMSSQSSPKLTKPKGQYFGHPISDSKSSMLSLSSSSSRLGLFRALAKKVSRLRREGRNGVKGKFSDRTAGSSLPPNKRLKDFQRDFYIRMEEEAKRRKALRCRKRWLKAYKKIQSLLKFCKNMTQRSWDMESFPSTFVDVGDSVRHAISYGADRCIDMDKFKRRKEISISSRAKDILTSNPSDRTLIQIEDARRELQKVEVFSKYPINVQERLIRGAFYLTIGPKRIIVRQGQIPQYFFFIICGEAYARERIVDPVTGELAAKVRNILKTGQTFGSTDLIEETMRSITVISRTNMQLLAANGTDYLEIFYYPSLRKELPPYLVYLSGMNFMENFPFNLLKEKLFMCRLHHFRRNTIVTHDSQRCRNLFIIKYGYCKVFRKLDWKDQQLEENSSVLEHKEITSEEDWTSEIAQGNSVEKAAYVERDSPHVKYVEIQTRGGNTVRVPITNVPRPTDKLRNLPLTLPKGKRQFLPLMLLREGEIFGLDQTPFCPFRSKSKAVILVSLGAEIIALDKDFYCRHASKEAKEVAEKAFIYDEPFIQRRLRERVNRDVHLEAVLKYYFTEKLARLESAKKRD